MAGSRFAADVAGFEADAIDDCDVNPVGDGVGALDSAPGVVLGGAELSFF